MAMSYDAVGVSSSDLDAGLDFFRNQPKNFPWVSANIYTSDNKPLFPPYIIKKINSLTVGIIGLTGQTAHKIDNISIGDWRKVLGVHLQQLKKTCDIVIVLSSLNDTGNRELANSFQNVDFLISSLKDRGNLVPRLIKNTMLTQCASQGKYLGKLHLQWYPNGTWQTTPTTPSKTTDRKPELINSYTSAFLPVRPVKTPSPVSVIVDQIKKNVNNFNRTQHKALHRRKNIADNRENPANEYAGTSACSQCHQQQYEAWKMTDHARAFTTLENKKQSFNSDCLPCHVTSSVSENSPERTKNLLLSLPPQLRSVGCEVCHGPGKKHIRAPKTNTLTRQPLPVVCLKCHTPKRDDSFDYKKKIYAASCNRNNQ